MGVQTVKFAKIIEEAGFNSYQFQTAASIPITLYDGNEKVLEKVHYARELFSENTRSEVNFFNFISYLEKKPVASMEVKIDENYVIAFYNTKQAISFKRTPSLDPMDYME